MPPQPSRVYRAWENFVQGGATCVEVRPVIARSWQRCRERGVDPLRQVAPTAFLPACAEEAISFRSLAIDCLNYFGQTVTGSDYVLVLSDGQGVLQHVVVSNKRYYTLLERHNFVPGADWSEAGAGTNAIGTALAEEAPVMVSGPEHYCAGWHPYACAAAPIRDLLTGRLLGTVDVSSFYRELHPHTLGWVIAIARFIEAEWRRNNFRSGRRRLPERVDQFPREHVPPPDLIGTSPGWRRAFDLARRAARTDINVLITGETGTGKEVLARFIHRESGRRDGPFVALNCAALPRELVVSELFGYAEGAFTGAARGGWGGRFLAAHRGTLFLDEIGDAPPEVQLALLRAIEEKQVSPLGASKTLPADVRIIAATSRNLVELMNAGSFRWDLYYRLAGITIPLPPLRERKEDVLPLAYAFLQAAAQRQGRLLYLAPTVEKLFLSYPWPGNVRELKNTVEAAAALTEAPVISIESLPAFLKEYFLATSHAASSESGEKVAEILKALRETGGNIRKAARLLGIDRSTLYRRLRRYGMDPRRC